jgi:hypothetical protein
MYKVLENYNRVIWSMDNTVSEEFPTSISSVAALEMLKGSTRYSVVVIPCLSVNEMY